MKNKLLKVLCVYMSASLLAVSMPATRVVYAAEENLAESSETEGVELEEGASVETEEAGTDAVEAGDEKTEETENEDGETEPEEDTDLDDTDASTEDTEEESSSETPSEDVQEEEGSQEDETAQEDEIAEELPKELETEELSAEKSIVEEVDADTALKSELLQKAQRLYPGMFLNEEGLFEYTDAFGVTHTYDPFDPEFAKYMLAENLVVTEADGEVSNDTASSGSNTSVSPFTGKTYTHESHVADKVIRHGIDVSKYQGNIDWKKAKADGVEFAIIRVGYRGYGAAGNMAGDSYAVQNIKNAYNAGVEVGIYFFSQAITEAEAEEEALYCYNFLKDNNLGQYVTLPVFIDYEYSPTGTSGRLYDAHLSDAKRQAICDKFGKVIQGYGYQPGIYANFSMLTDDMQPASSSTYSYMNYWIARYNTATKYSNKYCFWQYSSQGSVDGITVNTVDCNFWYEEKKEITDASIRITPGNECDYVEDIKSLLTIYDSARDYKLTEDVDYTVTYTEGTENGTAVISFKITGKGIYEGSLTHKVKVTQVQLSEGMVSHIPNQIFTGKEITTAEGLPLVIHHVETPLIEGADYTVSYDEKNISVGTATVTIIGMGRYTGEVKKTFQIEPMSLSQDMVGEIPTIEYTGSKLTTATGVDLVITNPNTSEELIEGTDYMVAYSANQNAGTGKLTITGKGNYKGKVTNTFEISKVSIGDDSFTLYEGVEVTIGGTADVYKTSYTGKAIKPAVTITVNGVKLKTDSYTVEYVNNKEVSEEAYVIIKGKKNYEGSVKKCFTIEPKAPAPVKLTANMVSLESTCIRATGDSIVPGVCVVQNGNVLIQDVDYSVSYTNSKKQPVEEITEAGKYNVLVKGIGGYTGQVSKSLEVIASDKHLIGKAYTDASVVSTGDFIYTGKAYKPEVLVTDRTLGDLQLVKNVDYTVSYTDNTKAGVARYTIKGKGKYTGTYTGTFEIKPADVGNLVQSEGGTSIETESTIISLNKYAFDYNGKAQKPTVTVKYNQKKLKEKTDYQITYTSDTQGNSVEKKNADTYSIKISFKGNYKGNATLSYKINPVDLSKVKVSVPKQLYNGNAICPGLKDMTVKLGSVKLDAAALKGVEVQNWSNNLDVSTKKEKAGFTLEMTGEGGNFVKGTSLPVTFTISAGAITDKAHIFTIGGKAVNGSNSELVLVYNDGVAYDRTNGADVSITDSATGDVLQEGEDYTLKYSANSKVGTASVKITGAGGYKGSKTIKFKIVGKPIGDGQAYEGYRLVVKEPDGGSYIYNGKAASPAVEVYKGDVLLQKNKDYTVKYTNNVNAGYAAVTVTGKGIYAGTISESYMINPKGKADAKSVSVSKIKDQNYTGKVLEPAVTVKVDGKTLKKGQDYKVSVINSTRLYYSDAQGEKGTATMFITGEGNYKGLLATVEFTVVKKNG